MQQVMITMSYMNRSSILNFKDPMEAHQFAFRCACDNACTFVIRTRFNSVGQLVRIVYKCPLVSSS